ncbi:HMG-Y-related protein A-like [Curcuma longa]|uniref:HMG-Y-related protein A-like n=1 Tax=Curcuma longa TaxID=136217 RepID=UPI003D9F5F41
MATPEDDPRTQPLPPYRQMILAAISAAGSQSGASKSSISDHIESTYSDRLPPSHASLLAAYLATMASAGELVLVGHDVYLLPDPEAPPPKRRGRPPKPRHPAPADAAPKRRGRPPKSVDPLAPPKIPRPRGRPPKQDGDSEQAGLGKRPRGRPLKARPPQFTEVGFV